MNIEALYSIYNQHPHICTDTRSIAADCLFFALKGEKFDANQYAAQALDLGAAYAVIDNSAYQKDARYILVNDVLSTLQDLARLHRSKLSIPVIGITGSNGKTTSKELINSVLSQHFKTFATQGNLNNHIGVPLSILSISPNTELAIIEMGANHQQEIEFLCDIAQPNYGIITNVGKAHLEGFGGFTGVMAGKSELYEHLQKSNGIAFINHDNALLLEMSQNKALLPEQMVYYGTNGNVYIKGQLLKQDPFIELAWKTMAPNQESEQHAQSQLTGAYNFENILAAICIGHFFKLKPEQINIGVASYNPTNNRSQLKKTDKNLLICDYYNANPTSMSFALDNLARMDATNKVIILGDMFELGDDSANEHQQIVKKAQQIVGAKRIFIGQSFFQCKQAGAGLFFQTTQDAIQAIKEQSIQNATILLKGSRGMKLEELGMLL